MSELPRGTVTFLFTDIEGSTALWERDHAAMQGTVERHLTILRQAIEQHNGVLFKTVGDAIQAAFSLAPDAVLAATAAQRALAATDWGSIEALPVRMALHAGTAAPVEADYLAPSLNRLSRLLSASHGGQVVLTDTVRRLLDGALPPDASLRDLGEHRLRDLLEPERSWQLVAPGLRAEFPPLRSLVSRPHNLPVPATALIGRESELATVPRLFRDGARLVTLTGPGGTGKTRLAQEVAAELLEDFPDGVWFLDLAGLRDPALLIPQIAALLGVRESAEHAVAERLAEHLAGLHVLLVLDNLEQFSPQHAVGQSISGLLTATTGLAILATSRAPLRLGFEREFPLAPLPVPALDQTTIEDLHASPAVQLFVVRAQAVRPGFALTARNAAAIAALCRRLDGLPLALELAAARVRALSPADILSRLGDRLDLLADARADRPDRQRTLEATIAWSYDLLPPDMQAAFRRLSVFAGGSTLEAAEAVLAAFPAPPLDALDAVTALVEQGLLRDEEQSDGSLRFRMLGTVRLFGLERLRESDEDAVAREAHARHYREFVATVSAAAGEAHETAWLDRLAVELDNVRAALERTAEAGSPRELLALAENCWHFWWPRGYWTEARMWLERALAQDEDAPTIERARALRALGLIVDAMGDQQRGLAHVAESRQRFQDLGDRHGEWQTLLDLSLLWASRDYGEAGRYAERALTVARETDNPLMIARSLNRLGNWRLNCEEPREAIAHHREALPILEGLGDEQGVAETLDLLGMTTALSADIQGATRWYARAVSVWRQVGDRQGLAASLTGQAVLAHSLHGDTLPALLSAAESSAVGEEGLALSREIGWRAGESFALWSYRGNVLGAWGEYAAALPSTKNALQIARDIDHPQWITGARCVLGELYAELGDFSPSWDELRGSLTLAQEIGSPYWIRSAAGKLACSLVAGGNLAEAAAVLEAHLRATTPMDTLASRIVWVAAADLALASSDPVQALEIADRLGQTAGDGATGAIPRVELLRGQALTTLGRHGEAEQALQAAQDAAEWCGARPLLWRILAARGRLAEAQGLLAEAQRAYAAAHSTIADLAAAVPDDALRALFLERAQRELSQTQPPPLADAAG